jgi:hypothetical protein
VDPDNTLAERIEERLAALGNDIKKLGMRLGGTKKMSEVFPEQPPGDYLHLFVQKPPTGECFSPPSHTPCHSLPIRLSPLLVHVLSLSFSFYSFVAASHHVC